MTASNGCWTVLSLHQLCFTVNCSRQVALTAAARLRRKLSAERAAAPSGQYARILANFRSGRLRKSWPTKQSQEQMLSLGSLKSSFFASDRKSLLCLVTILDPNVLSKLTDEDPRLHLMKWVLISNYFEGFTRIDAYLKSFWQWSLVVDSCLVVDNRIAIPNNLQKAFLARLHRSHWGRCGPFYLVASDASGCHSDL